MDLNYDTSYVCNEYIPRLTEILSDRVQFSSSDCNNIFYS